MSILLSEDDNFLRKLYTAKLEEAGYEVVTAKDGEETISKMKSEKPKLVLLDMLMPKKDGFEVLEEVQGDSALKKIPIIALTSLENSEDMERAKKLGVKDYCSKTEVDTGDFIARVQKILPN